MITASFVTIDLAGFTITEPSRQPGGIGTGTAIAAGGNGTTVRNGSISGFDSGVNLGGDGSTVEGLRVFGGGPSSGTGISAMGIVKGNTVVDFAFLLGSGIGIDATGIVSGKYVINNGLGIQVGQGSTVTGNTVRNNFRGIITSCPANVTDNTALGNNAGNLVLNGQGCNDTNNVAP
jgi:hypothetical protein